jgi:hypothetical protein
VNFKIGLQAEEFLQEIFEGGLCGSFPSITIVLRILSVCPHQWLQVNELSMY